MTARLLVLWSQCSSFIYSFVMCRLILLTTFTHQELSMSIRILKTLLVSLITTLAFTASVYADDGAEGHKHEGKKAAVKAKLKEKKAEKKAAVKEKLQEKKAEKKAAVKEKIQEKKAEKKAAVKEKLQGKKAEKKAAVKEKLKAKKAEKKAEKKAAK